MSYHREIANQTLKNQTASNVKIRCRLEKTGKAGKPRQAGDKNPVTTDPLRTISIGFIADGLIFNARSGPETDGSGVFKDFLDSGSSTLRSIAIAEDGSPE
jgi:hypothetical protein